MPLKSKETEAITFPTDYCVFAHFGAVPPGPTHYFACYFDSGA